MEETPLKLARKGILEALDFITAICGKEEAVAFLKKLTSELEQNMPN